MGRHAADDRGPAHPLVAAALTHRPADTRGAHRSVQAATPGPSGALGWPGPVPSRGNPVGWPRASVGRSAAGEGDAAEDDSVPAEEPVPAGRRGRRRPFGRAA